MKSFVITITGNKIYQTASTKCLNSAKKFCPSIEFEVQDAIVPKRVDASLAREKIQWNYPWDGEVFCFASGLKKSAYKTVNPKNRIACALSHFYLWKKCLESQEPILVLEHDAIFIKTLNPDYIIESKFDIIGINNPLGATRKARLFHEKIIQSNKSIIITPTIDEINIPQGLAGNSAYVIKPRGARNLIDAVYKYGLWPNDALMCKQIIPNLGVTRDFYTTLQGTPSTTTG